MAVANQIWQPTSTPLSPTLLDQEEEGKGEMSKLELNLTRLKLSKFLPTDIQTIPVNIGV